MERACRVGVSHAKQTHLHCDSMVFCTVNKSCMRCKIAHDFQRTDLLANNVQELIALKDTSYPKRANR